MAITSGFFNSVSSDRVYDAEAFNTLFDGIIVPGVIPNLGGGLLVEESALPMDVQILAGRAWFNQSWIDNDSTHIMTIAASSPSFSRWDVVALDFNRENATRDNTIVIIQGVPGASPVVPTLVNTFDHKQYALAHVFVGPGVTSIGNADITNQIGTPETPFASGLLQQLTTEQLLAQWDAQFYDWFNNLADELDSNQETNLQNQINDLESRNLTFRNILNNGRMQIQQRGGTNAEHTSGDTFPAGGPDRWTINIAQAGGVTASINTRSDFGINRKWFRLDVTTADASLGTSSIVQLRQKIEGNRLSAAYGGTGYAKPLTMSFLFRSNVTGTYIVELQDATNSRLVSQSFSYDVADTTESITLQFPPNLTHAWSSGSAESLRVNLWCAAGSNFTASPLGTAWSNQDNSTRAQGQVNLMSSLTNYAQWTDLQLEVGTLPTGYERLPDWIELANCQRYYLNLGEDTRHVTIFVNGSPAKDFVHMNYPVVMRAVPSITFFIQQQLVGGGWNYSQSHLDVDYSDEYHFAARLVNFGVSGQTYFCNVLSFLADAEL